MYSRPWNRASIRFAWLEMQHTEHVSNWPDVDLVFHRRKGPIGSHLKGWREAVMRAGLPGLRFHDLRRSAVRTMERAGIPRHVAMQITGHRTDAVYRRYDIVSQRIFSSPQRNLKPTCRAKW